MSMAYCTYIYMWIDLFWVTLSCHSWVNLITNRTIDCTGYSIYPISKTDIIAIGYSSDLGFFSGNWISCEEFLLILGILIDEPLMILFTLM